MGPAIRRLALEEQERLIISVDIPFRSRAFLCRTSRPSSPLCAVVTIKTFGSDIQNLPPISIYMS